MDKMDLKKECYKKAIEVLEKCATSHGFYASGGIDGYDAVWSRDSMIASLGASLVGKKFKKTFAESITTLSEGQSKNGQIPNCVDKWSNRKSHIDFKTIDSSLWYLIGNYVYKHRFDGVLLKKYKKNIEKTIKWLEAQDSGEIGLLTQLPTSDWQDAFPHKYGYTINTQALWYYVLILEKRTNEADALKKIVNEDKDDGLWNGSFYAPYRWKNHRTYKEIGEWFDSLGNVLAIVFGLADRERANKILDYIKKEKVDKPYPLKAIFPAIKRGEKEWQDYFEDCDAREPYSYLNGGVWTYIGSFYVLALIKTGRIEDAERALFEVAKGNKLRDWNFSEWVHGKSGEASVGGIQAWNAGAYILAYESLKREKVLLP
mgnify:CR=1 FL=1